MTTTITKSGGNILKIMLVLFFFGIGVTLVTAGNPCASRPCHYSRCISHPNQTSYTCQCDWYWTGDNCKIGPCDRISCFNGGVCNDYEDNDPYRCLCPPEWTGSLCQIKSEHDQPPSYKTNRGREFIFAFPENYKSSKGPKITVMSVTSNVTNVHVTIPGINFTKSVTVEPYSVDHIQFPASATIRDTSLHRKTVFVEASNDIAVYGVSDKHLASTDGFLALPVSALGTEYRIVGAMARPRDLYRSEFVISGTEDNTTINIYHRQEIVYEGKIHSPQLELVLTINRLESIQFQSTEDLTGTWVRSNKPISVLSGSRCGFIKTEGLARKSCEFMAIHLTPIDTWGRRFTVSPLLRGGGSKTVVRIITNYHENQLTLQDGLNSRNIHLYTSFYPVQEFPLTGEYPVTIISSKPIMVILYSSYTSTACQNLGDQCKGDGYFGQTMTYVPPLELYYNTAYFTTQGLLLPGYTFYLNVLTRCKHKDLLYLDDYSLGKSGGWLVEPEMREMCALNLEIPFNSYKLWSTEGQALFMAHLTGFRKGAAFSVPVGVKLGSADAAYQDLFTESHGGDKTVMQSTTGKEFIFAFTSSYNAIVLDKGPKVILIADKDAETDTKVTVKTDDTTTDVVIPVGQSRIVEVPGRVIAVDGRDPRPPATVHVTSSLPITVYGLNDAYAYEPRSDGFRALPTNHLGTEYFVISSYEPYQSYHEITAQFVIIGVHDGTELSVEPEGTLSFDGTMYYGGSALRLRVGRMQTLYFKSNGEQVGTYIIASKPVSVLSGSDCGYGSFTSYQNTPETWPCEHQIEHMIPVQSFGRRFVVPEFHGYEGGDTYVSIITSQDVTVLADFRNGEDMWLEPIRGGKFHYRTGPNFNFSMSSISANKPIMVVAAIDYARITGCQPSCSPEAYSGPAITLIPPLTPLVGNLAFTHLDIRNANNTYNYVTIVFACRKSKQLILNEDTLDKWGMKEHFLDVQYCTTIVQPEKHVTYYLSANQSDIAVSAIAYGFSGESSFAFPLI